MPIIKDAVSSWISEINTGNYEHLDYFIKIINSIDKLSNHECHAIKELLEKTYIKTIKEAAIIKKINCVLFSFFLNQLDKKFPCDPEQNAQTLNELGEKIMVLSDSKAMYNSGAIYHRGLGVLQDTFKAVKFYTHASHFGNIEAVFSLGQLYQTDKKFYEALKFYHDITSLKIIQWVYKSYSLERSSDLTRAC